MARFAPVITGLADFDALVERALSLLGDPPQQNLLDLLAA